MTEETKKTLLKMQAQCSRCEYCSSDILRKALKALDGDAEKAAEVVESLKADGFIDDLRYAGAFAREKATISGWGPVKIKFALSAKGIDRMTIDDALSEIDPDGADDKLEKVLAAKWKALGGDPQARLKLLKFALSRGYEYETVRRVMSKMDI